MSQKDERATAASTNVEQRTLVDAILDAPLRPRGRHIIVLGIGLGYLLGAILTSVGLWLAGKAEAE